MNLARPQQENDCDASPFRSVFLFPRADDHLLAQPGSIVEPFRVRGGQTDAAMRSGYAEIIMPGEASLIMNEEWVLMMKVLGCPVTGRYMR